MKFYFAPMEGITGHVYRNVHYRMFEGVDKYFTPFVSPTSNHDFKSREKRDVLPENNKGLPVVPQILTNHADEFIYTADRLVEYGYREINLNLGCPSGTVVSKGRGAGFLANPKELERFLDEVYEKMAVPVSIKTRLGKDSPEEFRELIKIFNRYPVYELTIHPRIRTDYYKNKPNWDMFEEALAASTNPVCYNGDINSVEDYERFCERFPTVERIMIGRGLIANPALVRELKTGEAVSRKEILEFADRLCQAYREIMPDNPVLFKMKEVWSYMSARHPEAGKLWKKLKKTRKLSEYEKEIEKWEL